MNQLTKVLADWIRSPMYVSECVGTDEQTFKLYKFRTMVKDADKELARVVLKNGFTPDGSPNDDLEKGISRILPHPIFPIVRKLRLDEIPNLINFAKGDLDVIGIRPKTEEYWFLSRKDHYAAFLEFISPEVRGKPAVFPVKWAFPHMPRTADEGFDFEMKYMEEYARSDRLAIQTKYLGKFVKYRTSDISIPPLQNLARKVAGLMN